MFNTTSLLYLVCLTFLIVETASETILLSPQNIEPIKNLAERAYLHRVIRQDAAAVRFEPHLRYKVAEERPAQTLVIADLAVDAGLTARYNRSVISTLRYSLLNTFPAATRYFQLDSEAGRLVTSEPIDREAVCGRTDVCLLFIDLAVQAPYFEIIKIELTVLDVNDNAPTFDPMQYRLEIMESQQQGNVSPIRSAVDRDSSEYGVKYYRLITDSPGTFRLDSDNTTGQIQLMLVLANTLDYERRNHYAMQVIAVDGGKPERTGTLTIDVIVLDVNDNRPIFTSYVYNVTIREDVTIGTKIVTVCAVDADSAPNGKIRYTFTQQTISMYSDMFDIDADSGMIVLQRALNSEHTTSYRLSVMAEDSGCNSVPPVALVIIDVIDVNDNAPQITIEAIGEYPGVLAVAEHSSINTSIVGVSVYDQDTGMNGKVNCSIVEGGNDFSLIALLYDGEYQVVTSRSFNFDLERFVIVTIKCYDHGNPSLSTSTSLNVTIMQILNDNVFAFQKSIYEAWLLENNEINSTVLNISVYNKGMIASNVIYSLGPSENRFRIDSRSGTVTALIRLNSKTSPNPIVFEIIATINDTNDVTLRVTARVYIMNENDTRFGTPAYILNVSRGGQMDLGIPVEQASNQTTDEDSVDTSTIIMSVVAGILVLLVVIVCVVLLFACHNVCFFKRKPTTKDNIQDEPSSECMNDTPASMGQPKAVANNVEYSDILTLDAEPVNYSARHYWQLTNQNKRDLTQGERDADSMCTEMTTSGTSCGSILRDDCTDGRILRTSTTNYSNSTYMYQPGQTWPRRSQCLDSPSDEFPPPPSPLCIPRYVRSSDHTPCDPGAPFFNNYAYERRPSRTQFERTTTFGVRIPSLDIPSRPAAAATPVCRVPRTYSTNGSLSSLFDKPLIQLGVIPPPMSLQRSLQSTAIACNGNGGVGMVRSASNGSRKSVRFADNTDCN